MNNSTWFVNDLACQSHPAIRPCGLPHIKVYDGKGKSLGRAFKVKLWPTLVLMRGGQEIERLVRPVQATEISLLLNK